MFKNCIQNKKKVFLDKAVLEPVLDGQVGRQVGSGLPIKECITSRGMQIALLFEGNSVRKGPASPAPP